MAQHAILRFEKHKGNPARPLEAHHERQKEQYASNPDIDASRSKYNFHIVKRSGRYYHFIQNRIEQAGCRTRRDSTRFVDTLITASPEFFKKKSPKEIQAFFQRAADFLIGRVGKENIVSAVVHMDEKTPHLHLVFVPLTEDHRLCAKEIIGNRANLTKWQDDFHAYMVEKYPDLERGESASKTGRKHIPTRLFKQAVNLSKQARAIEATLGDITPFNAGKKKEEALSMLKKWFPQMENFSGQLKKYKVTINDLLAENEQLEARAKASEKGKMKDTMERAMRYEIVRWKDGVERLCETVFFDSLGAFLYVDFFRGLNRNYLPRKCENCHRWFLLAAGKYSSCCNRPLKNEPGKTCRDVGSRKRYDDKCKNDPIWLAYNRAYKTHYARYLKKKMTTAQFEQWSRYAVELRQRAEAGEMELVDYQRELRV